MTCQSREKTQPALLNIIDKEDSTIISSFKYLNTNNSSNYNNLELPKNIFIDSISSSKYIKVIIVELDNFSKTRLALVKVLDSQSNMVLKYIYELKGSTKESSICYLNNKKIYSLFLRLNSLKYINKSDILKATNRLFILQNLYFKNVRRIEKYCNCNDNINLYNQKNIHYITKENIIKTSNTLLSDTQKIDKFYEYYNTDCSPIKFINLNKEIKKHFTIINRKNRMLLSEIKNQLDNKQIVLFYTLPSRIIYKLDYSRRDSNFFKLSNVEEWECLNTPIINCKVID